MHNRNSPAPITKVSKVSTVCDVMINEQCEWLQWLLTSYSSTTEALHVSATDGIRDSRAHVQCNAPSQILAAFVNVIEHVEQQDFQCHTETTNWRSGGARGRQRVCRNQRTAKDIRWTVSVTDWWTFWTDYTCLYLHLCRWNSTVTAVL